MGVQDRDWYRDAVREREGRGRPASGYVRATRRPLPFLTVLAIALAVAIVAAAIFRTIVR